MTGRGKVSVESTLQRERVHVSGHGFLDSQRIASAHFLLLLGKQKAARKHVNQCLFFFCIRQNDDIWEVTLIGTTAVVTMFLKRPTEGSTSSKRVNNTNTVKCLKSQK